MILFWEEYVLLLILVLKQSSFLIYTKKIPITLQQTRPQYFYGKRSKFHIMINDDKTVLSSHKIFWFFDPNSVARRSQYTWHDTQKRYFPVSIQKFIMKRVASFLSESFLGKQCNLIDRLSSQF